MRRFFHNALVILCGTLLFIKPISSEAQKCSSCRLRESAESARSPWCHHRSRTASREATTHMCVSSAPILPLPSSYAHVLQFNPFGWAD